MIIISSFFEKIQVSIINFSIAYFPDISSKLFSFTTLEASSKGLFGKSIIQVLVENSSKDELAVNFLIKPKEILEFFKQKMEKTPELDLEVKFQGKKFIEVAIEQGETKICNKLLETIDVNKQGVAEKTPLELAVVNQKEEIVRILLEKSSKETMEKALPLAESFQFINNSYTLIQDKIKSLGKAAP